MICCSLGASAGFTLTVQQPSPPAVIPVSGSNGTRQSARTSKAPLSQPITASGQAHIRGPSGGCGVRSSRSGRTVAGVDGRTPMVQ